MSNSGLDLVGIRLVNEKKLFSEEKIKTPEQAIRVLANELKYLDREIMLSINLNQQNQILNAHLISIGTINKSLVDPKSIFKAALLSNATQIILLHNHPSGNAMPSKEDYFITDKIKEGCELLQISLIDHIVIGKKSYYSMNNDTENEISGLIKEEEFEKC